MRLFLKIIGGLFLLLVLAIGGLALSSHATLPESLFNLAPIGPGQAAEDQSSILIFGATRNTGLMVAEILVGRGDKVTAFIRPTSDRVALEALGVDLVVGDAMDSDSIRAAMAGRDFRAVVTTIGCYSCEPKPDYQANANVITVAREAGIRRLVLITTIGAGDSYEAMSGLSKFALKSMLPLKTHAEEDLRASGLDYTIIRPGGLRSGHTTGNGVLTEERDAFGYIFREDLAQVIVRAMDDEQTIGKTLAAVDANRQWPWSSE